MADLLDLFVGNDNDWENDWDNDWDNNWNNNWNEDPCDGPSWNTPDWCDTQDQIESAANLVGLLTQPIDKAWPWIVGGVALIILMVIGMS